MKEKNCGPWLHLSVRQEPQQPRRSAKSIPRATTDASSVPDVSISLSVKSHSSRGGRPSQCQELIQTPVQSLMTPSLCLSRATAAEEVGQVNAKSYYRRQFSAWWLHRYVCQEQQQPRRSAKSMPRATTDYSSVPDGSISLSVKSHSSRGGRPSHCQELIQTPVQCLVAPSLSVQSHGGWPSQCQELIETPVQCLMAPSLSVQSHSSRGRPSQCQELIHTPVQCLMAPSLSIQSHGGWPSQC